MTVTPSRSRKVAINTLVAALVAAGVWTKMGNLWVLAAHDAQAARTNWILPGTGDLSEVNSPTFTADRGYTGDGATSYLVSSAALRSPYAQNSAHHAIWIGTNVAESGMDAGAAGTQRIRARNTADQLVININAASNTTITGVTDSRGHVLSNRTGSTTGDVYKNGVDVGDITTTTTTVTPNAFRLCAGDIAFSTKRLQAGHAGEKLTAQEVSDTYAALLAYMTAVGAA